MRFAWALVLLALATSGCGEDPVCGGLDGPLSSDLEMMTT